MPLGLLWFIVLIVCLDRFGGIYWILLRGRESSFLSWLAIGD